MFQGKDVIVKDLRIKYYQSDVVNNDNVLVFLHGWGSQAAHFQKTLEKCSNFIAIDLPGFGGSEIPEKAWSLDDYADFVKNFLQKLDIKNPILAGHSFGGAVAIKYCAQGNEIQKLILIGSAGIRKKNIKKYIYFVMAKVFKLLFSLPGMQKLRNITRKMFYKAIDCEDYIDAGALKDIYLNVISEDLTNDLKKINFPTVLIWGENDMDTPVNNGKLMHQLIKDSQLHIISDAGHYVFLDNEKEFNEIFLAQI
ncbi:MAG: Alpha/beta hydrolase fold protein [uncultured bacterium]|nr:MAG: Alpha/beta hydrolase fold protein [uncultured bacterium]HBR78929.1 alpha/beta hydrolase [Candidatus Moranbacteria bacterium]